MRKYRVKQKGFEFYPQVKDFLFWRYVAKTGGPPDYKDIKAYHYSLDAAEKHCRSYEEGTLRKKLRRKVTIHKVDSTEEKP